MQFFIIIALVIAALAIIFALQNMTAVTVTIFLWSFEGSLALVLLVTLAVGVLISILTSLPGLIRARLAISSQKKKLGKLESERADLTKRLEQAEAEIQPLEEQLASLSAQLEGMETPPPAQPGLDKPAQS